MSKDLAVNISDGVAVVTVVENECSGLWEGLSPQLGSIKSVVLDFSDVGYLNSMNIASVISLRNKLMEQDVGLLMGNVRDNIRSVFRILKLERLFNLELGLEQAIEAARSR